MSVGQSVKSEGAAIQVEGLGKRYLIGERRALYGSLRDRVMELVRAPFGGGATRGDQEEVWAIRDASFSIAEGEVVGLIGRNGAGKSTILKILSRITEPTTGRAVIRGRVGSLLEVGTGFHPELTGRENVFLNGAVLGMSRRFIQRQFDEIVDFSGVERFIDTPVKFYSSGMYLRLAFAVAAHLEPEILIVDEVLAVGDVAFQKKCLSKMEHVGAEGRTVLFVSHNLEAVARLCPRSILVDEGRIVLDGDTPRVVGQYLNAGRGGASRREWEDPDEAPGDGRVRLRSVAVVDSEGRDADVIDIRKPVGLRMEFEVLEDGHVLVCNHHVSNDSGVLLFIAGEAYTRWGKTPRPKGVHRSTVWIPGNFLAEGNILVSTAITALDPVSVCFVSSNCVSFFVQDTQEEGAVRSGLTGAIPGVVRPMLEWDHDAL